MSLQVNVVGATNVPNVEKFGKSDPYAVIEFQGIQKKTEVQKGELNPVWNQNFEFDLKGQGLSSGDEIKVYVKDWEMVGRNRLLGQATVPLRDVINAKSLKLAVNLLDSNSRSTGATLNISLVYKAPPGAHKPAQNKEVGQEVTVEDEDEEEEGEEEEDEAEEDAPDGADVTDAGGKKKKKKKKKGKRYGKRKIRGNLSNKPQDFQIRIKIVESRQLPGANISPVTRITCYNQTKQTRVQRSTNSPFWNEVFFFNFFCSPAELFDELITFGVYNSRKLRADAFIGSFKCDIGMIYDEAQHSFLHKWLLLSDPDDNMAGAKGYLKICATVLGPGDDAPSFKPATQDDDEDIESNLLRPAGVQLRPATFKLKLYRAEDIPRMDSDFLQGVKKVFGSDDKKELVDPYFVFSFAGKEVKSKIMYNNDHPEWNQELRLGLRFPSMCERIKLQMFDWDRVTEDDIVGQAVVSLSAISAIGDAVPPESQYGTGGTSDELMLSGFLPTFGPCYVNFYGSPREYSDLPDEYEDLNLGKGEGVAYRGRALVELQTVLGETPEVSVEDMAHDYKIDKFLRRRKYKLHAAFLNATMITAVDAPVEFEVSIGNYGNKLDESVAPCSSTTQPTNAVFDGSYYYFLPWGDTKPCVVVDSHWEDISFRLEALNMLIHIIERLEANMEKLNVGMQANLPTPELAALMIALLDQLVLDCGKPLPEPVAGQHVQNELDIQLRHYREVEMYHIRKTAKQLRDNATDVADAMGDVEGFLALLKNLAVEPQNSMPDVIIWMISGKRMAYYRCPAYQVLWSPNPDYCGKLCGSLETIMLKLPGSKAEKEKCWEIPALLRVKIWLGLEKHEMEWHKMQTDGELAVFAETYENQVTILGNWTNKGPTMSRPKFSDSTGKVKLYKEDFQPPPGWRWGGDWYISPELSMLYDKDAGHSHYLEDVYECHSRIPGGRWDASSVPWTDVKGDATVGRDEVVLPGGWDWEDEWQVDLNRAVDEDGWEYTVEATIGGYGPVEKTYHMCKRRRWVRSRKLVKDMSMQAHEEKLAKDAAEGWEYAPLFNMKFHHIERKMDLVRRRRWHRKMVAESHNAPCFFAISASEDEEDQKYKTALTAPRMFLTCKKARSYQLRAYIYQARDLLAGDSNGLSDPFARIVFLKQSQATEKLDKTLCPTWDQTLIFEKIDIHGNPEKIAQKPPEIIVEIFDHDTFGSAEFLGRTTAYPLVKLDPGDPRHPVLQWYHIKKGEQAGGELLAAFELFLMNGKDLPFLPPKRGKLYQVPTGVRPVLQRTAIEVMTWGVRNMKKFQLASVTSPSIELEVGGEVARSKVIRNTTRNPNFEDPLLFFDIMLPKEELYTPPLNIRVRDNRQFGRKPLVGIHVIKSLENFRCQPLPAGEETPAVDLANVVIGSGGTGQLPGAGPSDRAPSIPEHVIDMPADEKTPINEEVWDEDIDWWSKYYASVGELDKCKQYLELGYDKIQVYNTELEKVACYKDFDDFCNTFSLNRGKSLEEEESSVVGEFKGTFRVYPLPDNPNDPMPPRVLSNLPPSNPEECIVRVYIVKAYDLQPNDPSGLADPYVCIKLGKKKKDNQDDYLPNTLNPVFGKMFEMKATLPIEKDLFIQIKDYDLLSSDDVIGETVIDLENRFLTKYRATVGISQTYCISGPTEWRDSQRPKDILEDFCRKEGLLAPEYAGNTSVTIGNRVFSLNEFEPHGKPTHSHLGGPEQRLALHILNHLPAALGVPLVREHIETRPLYNPLQPGIEQGKLQMWVDIFPQSLGEPGVPADIYPRKPKEYELRIVVWNTVDVILEEESITGEKMSDIYVKGWISGIDEKQETDVHYRSLDGEGNFNWRFVFPFSYIPAEECVVVKRKEHFWSLDETEIKLPLQVMMQVWDNDKFSADDFLGTLELNMNNMPVPAKRASGCSLKQLPQVGPDGTSTEVKTMSLFDMKRVRGFWPVYNDESGKKELTGKIEMEMELVTKEEAEQKPAGTARDDPNQHPTLEPPNRPETSFLWFTSPLKTLRYIIWRNYKWYFIGAIIIILLIVFIVLFIYSVPGEAVSAMFNA